jgi:hypothetical protein
MRATYDEEQAAIPRLRSAAQMASAHGSVALLRRCEHDLGERVSASPLPAFRTRPEASASQRTLSERPGP